MRLEEAVELGSAWVSALAEEHCIRVLVIKGDTLRHHDLRPQRNSSDIDVLIEPSRFDEFCEALSRAGWMARPMAFISELTTIHSVSFVKQGWPCDIDAHRHFPGFLAPPGDVFESMWRRRESMVFAQRYSSIPSRPMALLIMALHSLRTTAAHQGRQSIELQQVLRTELSEVETEELNAVAVETGSVLTAGSLLHAFGIRTSGAHSPHEVAAARAWWERSHAGIHSTYFWIVAFRSARWRERPRILRRALWPAAADIGLASPEFAGRPWLSFQARISRIRRGFAQVPGLIRSLGRSRHTN